MLKSFFYRAIISTYLSGSPPLEDIFLSLKKDSIKFFNKKLTLIFPILIESPQPISNVCSFSQVKLHFEKSFLMLMLGFSI